MLSPAMTLGSSVRAKGILQEMQARLPAALKKAISLEGNEITLAMPARDKNAFDAAARTVAGVMMEAETLPVIPREIQDILAIKTSERRDGNRAAERPCPADHLPCLRSEGGRGPSRSRGRGRVAGGGRRGEGRETTESGLSEAAGSIAQKEDDAGRQDGSKGRRRCDRPSWMGRVRSGWVPSVGNRAKRGASSVTERSVVISSINRGRALGRPSRNGRCNRLPAGT